MSGGVSWDVRVSTANNDSRRTLAVDVLEDTAHLQLSSEISTAGEVVGGQQSSVVDAFNGEVPTVFAAELVTEGLANDGTLESFPKLESRSRRNAFDLAFCGVFFSQVSTYHVAGLGGSTGPHEDNVLAPTANQGGEFVLGQARTVGDDLASSNDCIASFGNCNWGCGGGNGQSEDGEEVHHLDCFWNERAGELSDEEARKMVEEANCWKSGRDSE